MKTTKHIKLKSGSNQISVEVGTILKRGGGLYIVAHTQNESKKDPVAEAIFGDNVRSSSPYMSIDTVYHNSVDELYNLINLSTGEKYFIHSENLNVLNRKINQAREFVLVQGIEIIEK